VPAQIFLLNGGSSVGKTTTARALQEASSCPLLRSGIDHLFASVPERWGGGAGGPLSRRGFHYVELPQGGGTRIGYGSDGWRMLRGHHRAVRAHADAGISVVVDELMLSTEVYADWLEALSGVPVTWVRVDCPLDVAEVREEERGQRAGLARGTHDAVHDGVRYDLAIDTSTQTPSEAAHIVLGRRL
jgi:chloramphenicol 3-O phosphotransferase